MSDRKQRNETLPTAIYEDGKWVLSEPYDIKKRKTCSVIGEMCDGLKVWADEEGNQFTRQKIYGKYYFCTM